MVTQAALTRVKSRVSSPGEVLGAGELVGGFCGLDEAGSVVIVSAFTFVGCS